MGEYLNTTRLKPPFIQSRLEEEQHHHLTGTSDYRKSKTDGLCDWISKATGKGPTVRHHTHLTKQPGWVGPKESTILKYRMELLNVNNSKNSLW